MSQYPGQYSSQMNPQNQNMGSGQVNYNVQGSMGQNQWASPSYAPSQNLQASNMNYGQNQMGQGNYQGMGTQMTSPQYQTFNPAQSQQNYPQIQTGYMGMPAQNQAIPSMGSMQSIPTMNSQPMMGTQAVPMMTNAVPGMMSQNIPQGQMIQQGQPMPLMGSQIRHDNIPMGQPLNPGSIPTGLAGNRDREWLLQYGNPNPDEMFLLREWFASVDQDKTGQIDVVKLQTALSASGEKFGENICFLLIKMFDVDGSQSINFVEFAQLYKFIRSMRAAFEAVDLNRSNLITLQQLQQALGTAGFNGIPPQYAALLFRKFDRNKRQKLSFENFMELCVILGHTKSWFIAKDTDLDGKVTLSLFELFELVSYC